jgi:membrane AbrB-like protein
VFALLHVPLAWMIGAMAATAAFAWRGRVAVHPAARSAALIVLGLAFGQTFSGPVLGALIAAWPAILAAGLLSILAGLMVMPVLRRLGGLDARSAYYAAVPGGVIVMAVLAQRAGASVAAVTLAQTIRVLIVVLVVPPLMTLFAAHGDASGFLAPRLPFDAAGLALMLAAGLGVALLLRRTGIANPWLIGPFALALAAAATGRLPSSVPAVFVDAAQVAMGASLGQRLTRDFLLGSRRLALASAVASLLLCGICAALGFALALAAGLPTAAVMLGLAPGGMPEMGVTAKTLGIAVPLVMAFHLTRTLMCNFLLGPLASALGLAGSAGRA